MVLRVQMDKYIEIMAVYWIDWQQTAIANTRYSVALAALALLIGGIIVAILKRKKIIKLMMQIMHKSQQLEKAEKVHEELISKQKEDSQQIAGFQQQIEQAATSLQKEREEHQTTISDKEKLFLQITQEKQLKIDEINFALNEKNQLTEQLTNQLNEQTSKIAQYDEAQAKITSLEKQIQQSVAELNEVKQQLDTELTGKNTQTEKLEKLKLTAQTQLDRILELESQQGNLKNSQDNEEKQQLDELELERKQLQDKLETERKQQEQNRLNAEREAQDKAELEKKVLQQKQQAEENAKKAEALNKPAEPVKKTEEAPVAEIKQLDDKVKVTSKPKKQGMVNNVLGWVSSLDKIVDAVGVSDKAEEAVVIPETEKSEPVTNQVIEKPVPTKPLEVVKSTPVVETKKTIDSASNIEDKGEETFSEKMAEVADKMDSFQETFKGFFNKKKS